MRDNFSNVIQRISEVENAKQRVIVVVSAFAGVTDLLIQGKVEEAISMYGDSVDPDLCAQMRNILRNFGPCDYLTSYGEKLSANLVSNSVRSSVVWADEGLITMDESGQLSCRKEKLNCHHTVEIVTGFCAQQAGTGKTVLLGRDGSDTTATLLSKAFNCHCTIFTDVDGIFNIDPRLCEDAQLLEEISLDEARELAFHGASVLHSRCLDFVCKEGLTVRNVNGACHRGTFVNPVSTKKDSSSPWTGIAVLKNRVCIPIQSASHINRSGFAADTFARFRDVSIDMVAQSCSQTQIAVVLREEDARTVPEIEIPAERLAIITVVGENMVRTPGVAAELFQRISSINVVSISQGASELSISVAIQESDLRDAVRALMK